MSGLYEKIIEYKNQEFYPFHMPGHKRNFLKTLDPYACDITEIDGFDDLHKPESVILDIMNQTKKVYHCDNAMLMVNGSTGGILTAISAAVKPKEKILIARNCHKSAYNAIYLRQLEADYIYPQKNKELGINLEVLPEDVDKALKRDPKIKAIFLTSPTFEGVVSDINAISKIAHSYNIPLIVDAAHGAHLGFGKYFPPNPLEEGADVVIMSLHKTLPSLTQTAVLCTKGNRITLSEIHKYINIYESSSPSYVLMSSIDNCMQLMEENGQKLIEVYSCKIDEFRQKCNCLQNLYLFQSEQSYDKGKIVICTDKASINGVELKKILLEKYKLEMEMQSKEYVIAMTSICDTEQGMKRLFEALFEIDKQVTKVKKPLMIDISHSEIYCSSSKVEDYNYTSIKLSDAKERVSAEYMYVYPPGVPLLVPGEIINEKIINLITNYKTIGLNVCGLSDETCENIYVLEKV